MSFEVGDLIVPKIYADKMNSPEARLRVLKVVKLDTLFKIEDMKTFSRHLSETDELRSMLTTRRTSDEDIIKHLNQNYICVVSPIRRSDDPFYVDKRIFIKFTGDASGLMGGSLKRSRTKKNKTVRRSRIKNSSRARRTFLRRS